VRQWISAEFDAEVSDFERALITGHVAGCPSCAAFRVEAAGIVHKLRSQPLEPFERRIEPARRRRMSLRLAPAVAAMAVSAVGLGSLFASSQVGPASGIEAPGQSSGVSSETSLDGPVSLSAHAGILRDARHRAAGRGLARSVRGGPVIGLH
jgi:predicted anti-sigma-YlaC factor YlaD